MIVKIKTYKTGSLPNRVHIAKTDIGIRVMAEYNQGWLTDWPIMIDNRILYDNPYYIPAYVKSMVKRAFKDLPSIIAQLESDNPQ